MYYVQYDGLTVSPTNCNPHHDPNPNSYVTTSGLQRKFKKKLIVSSVTRVPR